MKNKRIIHKGNIYTQVLSDIPAPGYTLEQPAETQSGRGGKRAGAGRKKGQKIKKDIELKKSRSIRMTDEEYPLVLDYLKKLRAEKKAAADKEGQAQMIRDYLKDPEQN